MVLEAASKICKKRVQRTSRFGGSNSDRCVPGIVTTVRADRSIALLYRAARLVFIRDDAGPNQDHRWPPVAEFRIAGPRPGDHADMSLRKPSSQRTSRACGRAGFRFNRHDPAASLLEGLHDVKGVRGHGPISLAALAVRPHRHPALHQLMDRPPRPRQTLRLINNCLRASFPARLAVAMLSK